MYNAEFAISQYLADKTFRHSDKVSKLQPDNFPYTAMYLNLEMTRTERIIKSFFLAYIPDRIRQISVVKSPARRPYDGRVRASRNCLSTSFPRFSTDTFTCVLSVVCKCTHAYLFVRKHTRTVARMYDFFYIRKKRLFLYSNKIHQEVSLQNYRILLSV